MAWIFISFPRITLQFHDQDGWGALFEDMKSDKKSVYALPVFLFHRLLLGITVGTTFSPNAQACRRQIFALIGIYASLLLYICVVRPFMVPLANLFEGLVVTGQMVCVSLNLWLLSDDCDALTGSYVCRVAGIALAPEDAGKAMNKLMMYTLVFMGLRFVAVMLPTWARMPRLVYNMLVVVPRMDREIKTQIAVRKQLEDEFVRERNKKRAERDVMIKKKQAKRHRKNEEKVVKPKDGPKMTKPDKKKKKKKKVKKVKTKSAKKKKKKRPSTRKASKKRRGKGKRRATMAVVTFDARAAIQASVPGAREVKKSRRYSLARNQSSKRLIDMMKRQKASNARRRFKKGARNVMLLRSLAPGPKPSSAVAPSHGDEAFSKGVLDRHRAFQRKHRQAPPPSPLGRFRSAAQRVRQQQRTVRTLRRASQASRRATKPRGKPRPTRTPDTNTKKTRATRRGTVQPSAAEDRPDWSHGKHTNESFINL